MYHKAGLLLASAFVALVASNPFPQQSQSDGGFEITSSFTQYGDCLRDTVACGSFDTDFNAAISENLYGADNGFSAGTCGTCWRLTVTHDMNGEPLSGTNSVVVKVNDLCPFKGNEDYCMPVGSKELNKYSICPPLAAVP